MNTIVLLTHSAALQHQLDETFGRHASVVLLTPPTEPTREKFDALFATWSKLADAVVLDAVSLGESARWAVESLQALELPVRVTVVARVTAMQRTVYLLPKHWLVFNEADPVEYLQTTLRTQLELRETQAKLQPPVPVAPRSPRPVGAALPDSVRYREALKSLSAALAQQPGRDGLLKESLRLVRELFGVGRMALFWKADGGYALAGSTGVRQEFATQLQLTPQGGIAGALAREGSILRYPGDAQTMREFDLLGTDVAVPVFDNDELVGVLTCGGKITGAGLSDDELELIYHLLEQVARAVRQETAAAEAARQRQFLDGVLANLHAGVIIVDGDHRVLQLNRLARELLELGEEPVANLSLRRLPSVVAAVLAEAQQTGQAVHSREVLLPRSRKPVGMSVSRVPAPGGQVFVALLDDLTETKQRQAEARELEEREFFTRVSYRLSHELKNSLVSIKIFGQLLPERYNEKDFREQFSNVVVNEVNRVDVLVNNLTFFAQPLGLVYEELSLSDLVDACVKNLTQEFARKKLAQLQVTGERAGEPTGLPIVNVKRAFGHKFARLAGDRIRLTQAMEHVMRNAVQSMPQGGRLTITTTDATEADYGGGKLPAGGAVKIEFVDSGEGIALADLPRVTEPFITTRNVGVGLGLTIVKKIIERHCGRLELDSMLGRGTTVRFLMPVVMQPHPEDKLLAQLAKSRSVSEHFSGETEDAEQNRLAQVLDANRRRRVQEP